MDFILAPDSLSASQIRCRLAEIAKQQLIGLLDVKVGTFSALLYSLKECWLIPEQSVDWKAELHIYALQMQDTFWAKSIKVDEVNVLNQIEKSLIHILSSLPLNQELSQVQLPSNNKQANKFNDLVRLHQKMQGIFPEEISLARSWYQQSESGSIDDICLYFNDDYFQFEQWQKNIIDKLTALTPTKLSGYSSLIEETLSFHHKQGNNEYTAISKQLFSPSNISALPDNFSGLTCRDIKQESELVASMIQVLQQQGSLYTDMVVQYPANSDYPTWLSQSFDYAGIPYSNCDSVQANIDWQTAFLREAITLKYKKTSPMTLMSLLINPLMPWSIKQAHRYANLAQDGRLSRYIKETVEKGEKVPNLLNEFVSPLINSSEELLNWLLLVVNLIDHKDQLGLTKNRILNLLSKIEQWFGLYEQKSFPDQCLHVLNQLQPKLMSIGTDKPNWLNSVTFVASNEVNLIPMKHLFIVGFNQGNYHYKSQLLTRETVFNLQSWSDLESHSSINLNNFSKKNKLAKNRFKQLIALVQSSLTLTASKQDFEGGMIHLSDTALDFALCFDEPKAVNPEKLFVDFEESAHPFISQVSIQHEKQAEVISEDIYLDIDLLALHKIEDDKQKPESPSSLETMMVSPLAWFLDRQGIKDKTWAIESLDILLQGTVAHKVFELYKVHQVNNDLKKEAVDSLYDELFNQAVKSDAPFLFEPHWRLELLQLKQQVKPAFEQFLSWLSTLNWTIEGVEEQLSGTLWDHPIKGYADAILKNNKGATLILDYKKSSSKDRIKRLNMGYDLQTYIYRELYQQKNEPCDIHSGYYTLNDKTMVLDQFDSTQTALNTVELECSLQQQSKQANRFIKERLEQLRSGFIPLNLATDYEAWQEFGIKAYALEHNPIISRLLKSDVLLIMEDA